MRNQNEHLREKARFYAGFAYSCRCISKELIDAAFPLTGADVVVSRNGLFPGFFSLLDHFWISSRGAPCEEQVRRPFFAPVHPFPFGKAVV